MHDAVLNIFVHCANLCMYRIQERANADWHVPQLLWQTAASDKIRGHRHIPEAELAARLWENTPENLRWDLDETIIRELEEQPPAPEPEQVEEPQTRASGSGWQYGPTRRRSQHAEWTSGTGTGGGASSSSSTWRPATEGWEGAAGGGHWSQWQGWQGWRG